MRVVLNIVGAALIVMGVVWILQGLNLLGGSFMTGQMQWAVIGVVTAVIGAGLLWFNARRRNG